MGWAWSGEQESQGLGEGRQAGVVRWRARGQVCGVGASDASPGVAPLVTRRRREGGRKGGRKKGREGGVELSLSLLLSFVSDVPFGRRRSRRRELFLICIVRLHWLQSSQLFSSSRAGLMPPLPPPASCSLLELSMLPFSAVSSSLSALPSSSSRRPLTRAHVASSL